MAQGFFHNPRVAAICEAYSPCREIDRVGIVIQHTRVATNATTPPAGSEDEEYRARAARYGIPVLYIPSEVDPVLQTVANTTPQLAGVNQGDCMPGQWDGIPPLHE
jgi:hypothetical protein